MKNILRRIFYRGTYNNESTDMYLFHNMFALRVLVVVLFQHNILVLLLAFKGKMFVFLVDYSFSPYTFQGLLNKKNIIYCDW